MDSRLCDVLPDDLFGGEAPICHLQLTGSCHIVAPHWLPHGVTHFMSGEKITLPELLDILHQMSALAYFEFRGDLDWRDKDKLHALSIQMMQLMNLIVFTGTTSSFMLLNQLLLLHVGVKRWVELPVSMSMPPGCDLDLCFIDDLSLIVEAANGFQHIHFSGVEKEGQFHLWTGTTVLFFIFLFFLDEFVFWSSI